MPVPPSLKLPWVIRFFAVIFSAALAVAALAAFGVRHVVHTPLGGDLAVVIEVSHGARLRPVLDQLGQAKVLRAPWAVYLYARAWRIANVRSGLYTISASQSPREILAILREGRVLMQSITVAEGLNRWQIRALMVGKSWMTAAQFDALCDDKAFLAENHVPGPSCEGFLYPETYKFARGTPAKDIFVAQFAAYRRQMARARAAAKTPVPLNELEFATLASIVEKETGAPEERPRIACVFYNRLKAKPKWKLETDPTVIYAATLQDPNFNGNITRWHLHKMQSPYNTYQVVGLPVGPISSPGAGALAAVANPVPCEDFFFVSKNHGRHQFCPTLACHLAAVKRYQVDYFRHARPPENLGVPPAPEARSTPESRRRPVGGRPRHRSGRSHGHSGHGSRSRTHTHGPAHLHFGAGPAM